jgi:hypothetical protein
VDTSQSAVAFYNEQVIKGQACRTALTQYRKDGSGYTAYATMAPLLEPDGSTQFIIIVGTNDASAIATAAPGDNFRNGVVIPMFLPMPLTELVHGAVPPHLQSHPELEIVQDLWIKSRGDRRLPLRTDFDLQRMARWASHLSIATVLPQGRFQFRLFGTELARVYGQDLTGRFLDELTPRDLWSVIVQHYQEVVRTFNPLFAPISIANGRWYSEVSRLLMPLATEDNIDQVSLVMAIDYRRNLP